MSVASEAIRRYRDLISENYGGEKRPTENWARVMAAYEGGKTTEEALKATKRKPKERRHMGIRKELEAYGLLERLLQPDRGPCKWFPTLGKIENATPPCKWESVKKSFSKLLANRIIGNDHDAREIADEILPVLKKIAEENGSFPFDESTHRKLIYPPRAINVGEPSVSDKQKGERLRNEDWYKWYEEIIEYCEKKLEKRIDR